MPFRVKVVIQYVRHSQRWKIERQVMAPGDGCEYTVRVQAKREWQNVRESDESLSALKRITEQLHWEWHQPMTGILCTVQPDCITFRVFGLHTDCSNTKRNESGEQTIRIWDDNDDPITLKYAISNLHIYEQEQSIERRERAGVLSEWTEWMYTMGCVVHGVVLSTWWLSLSLHPSPSLCVWVLWIHASKVTRSRNVAILLCSRSELIYVIGAWVCAWHKMITFKRRWQRASEILMLVGESMFLFLALNTLRSAHSTPNANANAFIPWFIPIRSFYM